MASDQQPSKRIKLDLDDPDTSTGTEADLDCQVLAKVMLAPTIALGDGVGRAIQPAAEPAPERWIELMFTWSGKSFTLDVAESDRVFDLKAALQSLTDVPPERQKILGLVKGKLPSDEVRIADLKINGRKFSLVGTPQGNEIKDPSQLESLPDVVNDLDIDLIEDPKAAAAYANDQRNLRKIKEHTKKLQLNIIHPLREGKRLLVLDIDYTILDTKPLTSGALPPHECARPRLHQFLEAVYPYYDICIWSQTSWIWLETKLVELGMLGGPHNYQISFGNEPAVLPRWCIDNIACILLYSPGQNLGPRNTIHVDDLSRNFVLNPNQGLKIHAFKNAHTPEAMADRELDKVARYMAHIASTHEDFTNLNHKDWKNVTRSLPP